VHKTTVRRPFLASATAVSHHRSTNGRSSTTQAREEEKAEGVEEEDGDIAMEE